MPYYYKKGGTSIAVRGRKMGTKKYRRANRKKSMVVNKTSVPMGLGFPKRMVMTHKYSESISQNTGASGGFAYYTWSCNSLYDPNSTGTGHQPMYFDQLNAIYDHYTVIGSKITIRAAKSDASVYVPVIIGCFINDDSTVSPTAMSALNEQSQSTHRMITGAEPITVFTKKWSAKKTFGGSILGNDNLQGNSGASPTEQSFFTVYWDSSANLTLTQVTMDVSIEYITVWDELRDIAGS